MRPRVVPTLHWAVLGLQILVSQSDGMCSRGFLGDFWSPNRAESFTFRDRPNPLYLAWEQGMRSACRTQWKNVTSGKCCLYSTKGLYFKSRISNWYTLTQKPSIETRRVRDIEKNHSGIFPFNNNELNKYWHLIHFPLWAPLLGLGTGGIAKTVVHSGGTVRTNWLENLH